MLTSLIYLALRRLIELALLRPRSREFKEPSFATSLRSCGRQVARPACGVRKFDRPAKSLGFEGRLSLPTPQGSRYQTAR